MFWKRTDSVKDLSRVSLVLVQISFIIVLLAQNSYCDSLFFIYNGPPEGGSAHTGNQFIIYGFDTAAKELAPVWTAGKNVEVRDIKLYDNGGPIILKQEPTKIFIIPTQNIKNALSFDLSGFNWIENYYYFSKQDSLGYLEIIYLKNPADSNPSSAMGIANYSIVDGFREVTSKAMAQDGELRLCGDDVVSFRTLSDIPAKPYDIDIAFDGAPVPDSIVHRKNSIAWVMIANESDFRAFLSVPEKNGLTQRELLIYNRRTGMWKSILLEGAQTKLELRNGWLVGRIADQSPETDFTLRRGVPPIARENVIIINPLTMSIVTVRLGGTVSSVLLIENDTVYYRIDEDLYRARISNSGFVDSELIVSDSRVFSIGRAFRGTMEPENK
jgi:hypothetical protein